MSSQLIFTNMKKLFLVTSLIASVATSSAFAKSEGSYLSLDVLSSTGRFHERYQDNTTSGNTVNNKPAFNHQAVGFGATYKYAFNFNNFFIAPGLFYERNRLTIDGDVIQDGDSGRRMEVKHRYGAKLDFGYDVTENFAPYLTVGYAGINYGTKQYSFQNTNVRSTRLVNDTVGDIFYGGGIRFDLNERVSLAVEYTTQNFSARMRVPNDYNNRTGVFRTRLDVAKFGIAVRF